jgi:solute carrier family 25 (mitochondrial iron transporter), member 28/37
LAGALATTVSDAFMNPFDVVKQRMQAYGSPYKTILECGKSVFQKEGLSAFFISYPTTLLLNIPFQSLQFPLYEYFRKLLNPSDVYSPLTHILAGSLAGAGASALTTPVDVIKTLLQTRGTSSNDFVRQAKGMIDAFHIVYNAYGLSGFIRGIVPRVMTHAPSTAICWTTYEYFKYFLSSNSCSSS